MKQKNRKRSALVSSLSSPIACSQCQYIVKFAIPLLIGIFIGSLTNNNSNIPIIGTSKASSSSSIHQTRQDFEQEIISLANHNDVILSRSTANNENDSGWHPIYVYYGDSSEGLKSSEAPLMLKTNSKAGSQVKQDEIILKLIEPYRNAQQQQKRRPYFIDLAANDATSLSNTYQLEQNGWEGLCIEPNPVYWFRLAHRKCVVVGAFVGGKEDMEVVDVSLENKEFGGIVGDQFDNHNNNNDGQSSTSSSSSQKKQKRFTISIRTMFRQFQVPSIIDYLSLDVEGAEELVMNDFPFDTNTIRFITIERPKLGLQKLLKEKKYHFVMQLVSWGETLWVHDDVLKDMSMEQIHDIVSRMKVPSRRVKKGQDYFDIKTGRIVTK